MSMQLEDISLSRELLIAEPVRTRPRGLGPLGKLAPSVLVLWVLIDLGARCLSPSFLQLDPWLVVSQCPPRYSPFRPNQRFYLRNFVGGNAREANLAPQEIC